MSSVSSDRSFCGTGNSSTEQPMVVQAIMRDPMHAPTTILCTRKSMMMCLMDLPAHLCVCGLKTCSMNKMQMQALFG